VKGLVRSVLRSLNLSVMRYGKYQRLEKGAGALADFDLLVRAIPDNHASDLLDVLRSSQSQLHQDLFALSELDFKRDGFFVEFGATDGVTLSNTMYLERKFGWTGIVAEPARRWHEQLKRNRSCHIETKCVWKDSASVLTFNEADSGEYSTIDLFSSQVAKRHGQRYAVETISLRDMLIKYSAPQRIDYISIDTEGSEFEILSPFDFEEYEFGVLTIEHNFEPHRDKIFKLLTRAGYRRKFENLSSVDDWYVRAK
jgi:FkbM family methyltransferase